MLSVAATCAAAGIIVGIVTLTGAGSAIFGHCRAIGLALLAAMIVLQLVRRGHRPRAAAH